MKIFKKTSAKLNLFLEVTGKRTNGYHELESLVAFLDLADEIIFEPSSKLEFSSEIPDNIILKTARRLNEFSGTNKGAKISLKKNIPIGGGLGGGSSDAAITLVTLNEMWELNLSHADLYKIALTLGADVPVCLYSILKNKPAAIFKGIGEIIEPAPQLPNLHILLVNPNIELATEKVFKNFAFKPQTHSGDFYERRNDLEPAAIKLIPEIGTILKTIATQPNCQLARMTGSGATCFGLFQTAADAKAAYDKITSLYPKWWAQTAKLKD